jgi:hypothetical protein
VAADPAAWTPPEHDLRPEIRDLHQIEETEL